MTELFIGLGVCVVVIGVLVLARKAIRQAIARFLNL